MSHSRTQNETEIIRTADILMVALGRPEFIIGDRVKDGVTVIGKGIPRVADEIKKSGFRLLGDVHVEFVSARSEFITPVPIGVGSMIIASVMRSALKSSKLNA